MNVISNRIASNRRSLLSKPFAWSKTFTESIVSIANIRNLNADCFRAPVVSMERKHLSSKGPDKDFDEMTEEELKKLFTLKDSTEMTEEELKKLFTLNDSTGKGIHSNIKWIIEK
jgi:hypothetical protein